MKRKANAELTQQNELILEQKKEITDSISYALNIQRSMLSSQTSLAEVLPEHFVLYKPKDIVSGDFYFVHETGDSVLFSAVDCTGHGVPGALMSVLGIDILQDATTRRGLVKPAEILHHLDKEINIRLRQASTDQSVKDGMDLALCKLNRKTNELEVSAAFSPVYIVSNGSLEIIRPDKYEIGSGKGGDSNVFTTQIRKLAPGDCVYVLSDGFADQFGGKDGKKFKYKPLQDLLVAHHAKSMMEQKAILESTFLAWKGGLFQVDDILIIGVRV